MNDLIINVAAGLISGVVAPFVVIRLGGGTPPSTAEASTRPRPAQEAVVDGSNNTVTQTIDQSTSVDVIYARLPSQGSSPVHGSSAGNGSTQGDGPLGTVMALVVAAGVLVLTYLFLWPVVVYAFVGAAFGIAVMAALTATGTRGTPGPRTTATALMAVSVAVMLSAAWWTMHGGPGSDASFANLEASVAERFPMFSGGLEGRWAVVTSHPGEILSILGWDGFFYVLTQVGAVVFAGVLVWARIQEVSGWIALHSLTHNRTNPRLVERAARFKELGAPAVWGTLVAAVAICLCAGGWAHAWIEVAQSHQTESVVDSR